MINWKVRIRNKNFWITLIPALIVLVESIATLFGFTIELTEIETNILGVVNAVFVVLSIIGIINDPTTVGMFSDSTQALSYDKPKDDGEGVG